MMLELGLIAKRPRIVVAQAAAANPLYSRLQVQLDVRADDGAADARVGDPDRQPGLDRQGDPRRCSATTASSSRRPRASWPTRPRAPIAPGCSTARTPASRSPRSRSWSRAGEVRRSDRVIVISTANGLKFTEFKTGVSHADAGRRDAAARESAGRAAERLRRGPARDRSTLAAAAAEGSVNVARSQRAARSLEIRRRLAGRRRGDSKGRGAHRRRTADRSSSSRRRSAASPICCSRARARGDRPDGTPRPDGSRRRSCGAIATSRRRSCRPARRGGGCSRRSTRPRASTASCASRSACSAISRRARATCSSRAASGCRRRSCAAALSRARRRAVYVDAAEIVATDGQHGGAAPNLARRPRAWRAGVSGRCSTRARSPVVPGFIGRAPDGSVTTLGRGGSDLTATLLARALGAQARRALEGRARAS